MSGQELRSASQQKTRLYLAGCDKGLLLARQRPSAVFARAEARGAASLSSRRRECSAALLESYSLLGEHGICTLAVVPVVANDGASERKKHCAKQERSPQQ